MPIKDPIKAKEYARISMLIKYARNRGEDISQLLEQRKSIIKSNGIMFKDNIIPKKRKGIIKKNNSTERAKRSNDQPRIILGTSDFKKLRLNNAIIVDKSLLIKAILEAPSEVPLIARPRR